jgi:carboxylesterase type B
VRFADAGDPNGEGGFDWPAYGLETEPALFIETRESIVERWNDETCDFWDAYDGAG